MEKGIWIAKTYYIKLRWKYNSKHIFLDCKRTGREEKWYPSYFCPGQFAFIPHFLITQRDAVIKSHLFACKLKNNWKPGSRLRSEMYICTFMAHIHSIHILIPSPHVSLLPSFCISLCTLTESDGKQLHRKKKLLKKKNQTWYKLFLRDKYKTGIIFWTLN